MREVTRPMRGEVTVRAQCLMPERLLERAMAQGARFCNVRRDGAHGLVVDCDAASARVLLNQCERYRLDAELVSRRGRSALAAYARRRATLPVGLLVAAALCWLFLSRIWLVDVAFTGDAAALGDRDALLSALSDMGVRPGIARGANLEGLSKRLRAGSDGYGYVGMRLQGVRLLVEAAPEVPSPPLYDVAAARDLVASRDGIVLSAVARSGELCVQPGDAVRRGQLLIRGEEKAGDDATEPVAALGEVVVRTWFEGEASLPLSETRVAPTGRTSASTCLKTPWFSRTITEGESFADQVCEAELLPIGGLFLPVAIERVTRREVVRERVSKDESVVKAHLQALATADAAQKLSREGPEDFSILRRWVDFDRAGDTMRARAVIEVSADAAATREMIKDY